MSLKKEEIMYEVKFATINEIFTCELSKLHLLNRKYVDRFVTLQSDFHLFIYFVTNIFQKNNVNFKK